MKRYPNEFKYDDFEYNKAKVTELVETSSKLMRNQIAGYVTRYLVSRNKPKQQPPISE